MATRAKATPEATEATPETAPADEPTPEQYETAREALLAKLPPDAQRPLNVYARLAQIAGFVGQIKKTGENKFHHYKYAKEADLVENIRPILSEYGIWLEQGLVADLGNGISAHQRLSQGKSNEHGTPIESLTIIAKRFRFVWWNTTSSELETTEWSVFMGYGDDTGDKGYYKAETGSVKYFLMKTFLVATGDDVEGDTKTDERAAARSAATRVNVRRPEGRPAEHGGRQQQTSAPQARQIGELLRAAGAKTTITAITKLEELSGVKIPIEDPEDLSGALTAYVGSLTGPQAGAIVQKLREEAAKPADQPADEPTDHEPPADDDDTLDDVI